MGDCGPDNSASKFSDWSAAMAGLVTIFGGSGFLGRYVARRMAAQGWRVRVAVRRPNESMHVKTYGSVGQVEPVFANIRDDASVQAAVAGADAVVNCVGTFDASGRNNYTAVHVDGAERIARLSAEAEVKSFIHVSAIGADESSESEYSSTKAKGEHAVLSHISGAVILRPSVIFGAEDKFFNRFAGMARLMPVLAIAGASTKFQPVYVGDVAEAVERAILQGEPGTYELGGPEVKTLSGWMETMQRSIRRNRLLVNIPFFVANIVALGLDIAQAVTLGLFKNSVLTRDQVRMLRNDNVVSNRAKSLEDLGVVPTSAEIILDEYLWPYRPSGQFFEIKESAKNLKSSNSGG